jgi:RNA polymerase primary sigma factor
MRRKKKIAAEFEQSAQAYFSDIGEYKPLSREEEISLWERYKLHNDISARDKIIKSNLKFVASVARGFQGRGLSYSDLIAEGNIGLMRAIDKFDYERGYKTISYSVWWIKQSILEALNERNSLRGDELPSDIEKPIDTDDDNPYVNATVSGNDKFEDTGVAEFIKMSEMKSALSVLMQSLTERERIVLSKYYGLCEEKEKTLEEIGKEFGLTKERVRQIKEKALKKLRSEALKNSITEDIYN